MTFYVIWAIAGWAGGALSWLALNPLMDIGLGLRASSFCPTPRAIFWAFIAGVLGPIALLAGICWTLLSLVNIYSMRRRTTDSWWTTPICKNGRGDS